MNKQPIYTVTCDNFMSDNQTLQLNTMGITFCMFWSRRCKYCPKIMPEFQKLVNVVSGINLALMCIEDQQNKIVSMASRTTTPLTDVPTFIIYHDGTPFATYTGAGTLVGFSNFLKEIIPKIRQQEQARPMRTRLGNDIPQQMHDMQPPVRQLNPPVQQPYAQQYGQQPQQQQQQQQGGRQQPGTGKFTINPNTQVKEYESSYGRPYNTANEAEFLESEAAYVPKR